MALQCYIKLSVVSICHVVDTMGVKNVTEGSSIHCENEWAQHGSLGHSVFKIVFILFL